MYSLLTPDEIKSTLPVAAVVYCQKGQRILGDRGSVCFTVSTPDGEPLTSRSGGKTQREEM